MSAKETKEPKETVPRLKKRFQETITKELLEEYSYKSVMQVPKLEKIVLNMGVGEAAEEIKEMPYKEYQGQMLGVLYKKIQEWIKGQVSKLRYWKTFILRNCLLLKLF